jgi:large subunit ribosomal protein L16
MRQPKRTKYRKQQKDKTKMRGVAKGGTQLNFGQYGLKAETGARVSARQIEAARRSVTRRMRRIGKLWIRVFPDVPVTEKPAEVRMGKGKGTVEWWCTRVHPGRVIFELDGVSQEVAEEAFRLASAKLPVKTKFITRLEG